MAKIWHILAPLLGTILFLLFCLYTNTTSDLKSKIKSFFLSGPCPSTSSINWVVTSGKLNLVQKTALESIFLHNPDACLNIYVKEDMEDFDNILHHVKRLQNDGFLIFILKYNFRELLSQTVPELTALPTIIVKQFLQQLSTYEKGDTTSANVKRKIYFAFKENIGRTHTNPTLSDFLCSYNMEEFILTQISFSLNR